MSGHELVILSRGCVQAHVLTLSAFVGWTLFMIKKKNKVENKRLRPTPGKSWQEANLVYIKTFADEIPPCLGFALKYSRRRKKWGMLEGGAETKQD